MRFTEAERKVLLEALSLRVSDAETSTEERSAATSALHKIIMPAGSPDRTRAIEHLEDFFGRVAAGAGLRGFTLGPAEHVGPWSWSVSNQSLVFEARTRNGVGAHVLLSVFDDGSCGVRLFGDRHLRETDPLAIACEIFLTVNEQSVRDVLDLVKATLDHQREPATHGRRVA